MLNTNRLTSVTPCSPPLTVSRLDFAAVSGWTVDTAFNASDSSFDTPGVSAVVLKTFQASVRRDKRQCDVTSVSAT